MLRITQQVLLLFYTVLPVTMLLWSFARRMARPRTGPAISLGLIAITGSLIGAILLFVNVRLMGGQVSVMEGARLVYLVISVSCLIRLIDVFAMRGLYRWARVELDPFGRPRFPHRPRAVLVLVGQRVLLLAFVIPYAFALLITYRPRIVLDGGPGLVGLSHEPVTFRATDGVWLSGWWLPARSLPPRLGADEAAQWGQRTVILCHGIGSGKERVFGLAWVLVSEGFNVLSFDFRGHGQSGGNMVSYGDREREDVLAAVRWVVVNKPAQARRILGVGANTGAAALLAAAADKQDGRAIDALVLFEPFARLDELAATTAEHSLPAPIAWLVDRIGLPLASLHSGSNLGAFAPIDYVNRIWPRPVLVIFGRGQTFVPISQQLTLYQAASQPKESFWPADNYEQSRDRFQQAKTEAALITALFREWLGTSESMMMDGGAQHRTVDFLHEADSVPAL